MAKEPAYAIPYHKDGSIPRRVYRWSKGDEYDYQRAYYVKGELEFTGDTFWNSKGITGVWLRDTKTGATYPVTMYEFLQKFIWEMFKGQGKIKGTFRVSKQGPVFTLRVEEVEG